MQAILLLDKKESLRACKAHFEVSSNYYIFIKRIRTLFEFGEQ